MNTKFRVNLDTPQPVELELVEVNGYLPKMILTVLRMLLAGRNADMHDTNADVQKP